MSADINTVTVIGNLVRDAEQSYTTNGYPVVKFGIAVNKRRKRGDEWIDEANFFEVKSFNKQAEAIAAHLVKGQKVACTGELQQDRCQAEDGTNRSKVFINASYVQLLGGKKREERSSHEEIPEKSFFDGGTNKEPQFPKFPPDPRTSQDNKMGGFEDDIPF